jgi:hypothetical protein
MPEISTPLLNSIAEYLAPELKLVREDNTSDRCQRLHHLF